MDAAGGTWSNSVGPSQNPSLLPSTSVPRPSTTSLAPAWTPASTYEVTLSRWAAVTSGPMSQPRRPSPVRSWAMRWVIRATRSSPTGSTATTTETAMHRSPADPKPADTAASAAASRSASGRTTMWFFAPPRAWTRLPPLVPVSYTWRATGVEPTKLTARTSGWVSSRLTATASPWITLKTPSGSPASAQHSARSTAADGSFSLGLSTTALPQAIAMGANHSGTMTGKLNGVIRAHTPTDWRIDVTSICVETDSENPPLSKAGIPQANSTTSRPRAISPSASLRTLPCSDVTMAASSSRRRSSAVRKSNRTRARRDRVDERQERQAALAAATAVSTSASEAKSTCPVTVPRAGSKTSPWRRAVPVHGLPSIQCVTYPAMSGTRLRVHGRQGVDEQAEPFPCLRLGERERRRHAQGRAVEAALADEQAPLLGFLHGLACEHGRRLAGAWVGEVDGEHESLAAHVGDGLEVVRGGLEPVDDDRAAGGVLLQVMGEHVVEGGAGRAGGDRVAAEGGDAVAADAVEQVAAPDDAADREAVGQALRE